MGMTGDFQDFRAMLKEQFQSVYDDWSAKMEKIDGMTTKEKRAVFALFDEWDALEQQIHQLECEQVNSKLGAVIPPLVCNALNDVRKYARNKVDKMYADFEELRKEGMSFKEAFDELGMEKIERMGYEKWLAEPPHTIENTVIRPAQYWLSPGNGYDKLKEMGIKEFVKRNSMFMYDNKINNE